jgi:hypothetical protein
VPCLTHTHTASCLNLIPTHTHTHPCPFQPRCLTRLSSSWSRTPWRFCRSAKPRLRLRFSKGRRPALSHPFPSPRFLPQSLIITHPSQERGCVEQATFQREGAADAHAPPGQRYANQYSGLDPISLLLHSLHASPPLPLCFCFSSRLEAPPVPGPRHCPSWSRPHVPRQVRELAHRGATVMLALHAGSSV